MPINDIVADAASRKGASLESEGNAPSDDNVPEGGPAQTTMRTKGPMLPPYLHIQTLDRRSAFMMLGTVFGFIGLVRQVMG